MLNHALALKMEEVRSSETSANSYWSTLCHPGTWYFFKRSSFGQRLHYSWERTQLQNRLVPENVS
jgi:hypothetical protein